MIRADSVHHKYAAQAACQILNQYFHLDEPKSVLFGRIMFCVKAASEAAARELHESRATSSDN